MGTTKFFHQYIVLQRGTILVTSCLLFWTVEPFQYRVYSERKEFSPKGANSFLEELTSNEMGGKTGNERAAYPERIHIHLNTDILCPLVRTASRQL